VGGALMRRRSRVRTPPRVPPATHARVAQPGERRPYKAEVGGSTPSAGTQHPHGDRGVPDVHARSWPWKAWVQLPVITPSASWTAARPAGCNPAAFGQTWVGTRGAHHPDGAGSIGEEAAMATATRDRAPPVWLLDVDGVINATRPGWGSPPRRASVYADGGDWPMRWAPALNRPPPRPPRGRRSRAALVQHLVRRGRPVGAVVAATAPRPGVLRAPRGPGRRPAGARRPSTPDLDR
jgi:hypothetical protein